MADLTRRAALAAVGALSIAPLAFADAPKTAWDFSFTKIDETGPLDFAAYKGRVLLVTNTASFCMFTYEYGGLEKLQAALQDRGLTVIGIPSQDFGQETDSNGKVKKFCDATFGVRFPMSTIAHVVGAQAVPFYAWVKAARDWEPKWNFNKVLIGRDGGIKGTFGSTDEPQGPVLSKAIATELARPLA
jgi:glutathione peroxidase